MGLPRSNLVKKPALPSPLAFVPPAPPVALALPVPFVASPFAAEPEPARESLDTKADSVEVEIECPRGPYVSAPSASELLERAAAMGPARMTWESIVLVADPILSEKRQPHVAERRERLTRVVKYALGACVAVCVLALGVSALSGDSTSSSTASAAAAPTSVGKTVASKGVVPVEPLDGTKHGKAMRRAAPAVTTAAIVRSKRR